MKMVRSMVIMASLIAACVASAKEGDVETKVITKRTGAEAILNIGECHISRQTDYNGKPYIVAEVNYVLCKQYETYTADVTDNGLWKEGTEANIRDRGYSTKTSIERSYSTYTPTQVGQNASNWEVIGSIALDTASIMNECKSQRDNLMLSASQNSKALVSQCGQ